MISRAIGTLVTLIAVAAIGPRDATPFSASPASGLDAVWTTLRLSNDWLEPRNWVGNQVPNAPGDRATVNGFGNARFELTAPVTLGSLTSTARLTDAAIVGPAELTFDNGPAGEPAIISVQPSTRRPSLRLETPATVVSGQDLTASIGAFASAAFEAGLTGDGTLRVEGGGALRLANPASVNVPTPSVGVWSGPIDVVDSTIILDDRAAVTDDNTPIFVRDGGFGLRDAAYENKPLALDNVELFDEPGGRSFEWGGRITLTGDVRGGEGRLLLNGPVSGPGGIDQGGASQIELAGNNTYAGETVVRDVLIAATPTALGSSAAGTTVLEGGALLLRRATDEPITLDGGQLRIFLGAASAGSVAATGDADINFFSGSAWDTPIALVAPPSDPTVGDPMAPDATPRTRLLMNGIGTLRGGVTGVGDVVISEGVVVDGAPLAHDGGLRAQVGSTVLATPNTYTGPTVVTGSQQTLRVEHPDALGVSTTPVVVEAQANLISTVPLDRDFDVASGARVRLETNEAYHGTIRFSGSVGVFESDGPISGQVLLESSPFTPILAAETIASTISGNSDVSFRRGRVTGDNTYTGVTRLSRSDSDVTVGSANALGTPDRGTAVFGGVLRVDVETDERFVVSGLGRIELNVPVPRLPAWTRDSSVRFSDPTVVINAGRTYDEDVLVLDGDLVVNESSTVRSLTLRDGAEYRSNGNGRLRVLSGEVVLESGNVTGRLTADTVRKTTPGRATLGELRGYAGDIVVDGGVLLTEEENAFGTTAGAVHVHGDDAVLQVRSTMTVEDDIFLHNTHGLDNRGALLALRTNVTPTVTLTGRLDLGDEGSSLGGVRGGSTGRASIFDVRGTITGGALRLMGDDSSLRILSDDAAYTGRTDLVEGRLILAEQGRLAATSEIVLGKLEATDFDRGRLELDNRTGTLNDRVADDVTLVFAGGELLGRGDVDERFHSAAFERGDSTLRLADNDNANRTYTFGEFTRETGAMLFATLSASDRLFVESVETAADGVLPWALASNRLGSANRPVAIARVVNGEVVQVATTGPLNDDSTAADHATVPSATTLSTDVSVGTLLFSDTARLDLGGNRLDVATGGLAMTRGTIENGTLTSRSGELVLHGGHDIRADLVDDPSGPLAVTTAGGVFRGDNRFTGGLYVNQGDVTIAEANALPAGGDVSVYGAELDLGFLTEDTVRLGVVSVAGSGEFLGDSRLRIDFERVEIESGFFLPGQLTGDGVIRKTGLAAAGVGGGPNNVPSEFFGTVLVEEGALTLDGTPNATILVTGGELRSFQFDGGVTLDGGTLTLTGPADGDVHVAGDSTLKLDNGTRDSLALRGRLLGDGDLTIRSSTPISDDRLESIDFRTANPDYSGDVRIDGARVSVRDPKGLGTGTITVGRASVLSLSTFGFPADDAPLLANDVVLDYGELVGPAASESNSEVASDITVRGFSYVDGMNLTGRVTLTDGSVLATIDESPTRFSGELAIDGEAELRVGRAEVRSSALRVDVGAITIDGVIVAEAPGATLNVFNEGFDDFVLDASYRVEAGASLAVTLDGELPELVLDSPDEALGGGGSIDNPVVVRDGGVLRPGSSPGVLEVTTLNIDGGAVYEWEYEAGEADLIQASGLIDFDATPENPWLFRPIGILGDEREWVVMSAAGLVGFDPLAVAIDNSSLTGGRAVSLTQVGGDLVVTLVPEPASAIGLTLLAAIGRTRQRDRVGANIR